MGHQASELRVNLQDQAAQYESKVSMIVIEKRSIHKSLVLFNGEYEFQLAGKDQEILFLQQENERTKREYEKMFGIKREEMAEVRVYSGLIVPEIQRMRRSVTQS